MSERPKGTPIKIPSNDKRIKSPYQPAGLVDRLTKEGSKVSSHFQTKSITNTDVQKLNPTFNTSKHVKSNKAKSMNGRPTSSLVCEVDIKAAVHIVHNNNVAIDTKSGMKIVADTEKLWLRRPGNLAPEKIRLSSIKSVCKSIHNNDQYTLFEMIYEDNGGQSSLCVVSKTKADRLNNLTEWIRRYADREAFDMPSEKLALYLDKVDLDESQRMPTRGTPVVPGASLRTTAKSPITIDGSIRRSARLSGVPSVGISQERDNTIMFRFPPDQPLSITVTAYEKTRLADGEFLNDTVIEFYIRYLAFVHPDWYKEVHIFNSFFFQKLSPRDKPFTKEEGYEAVKRWTKNVDIFAKDFIIIPINESLHWYLSIVCYPGRALSQEIVVSDTEAESDKSGPIYQTISPDKPSDDVSEPMQVDAPGSLHGGGDWTPVYHHTERIPAHASPSNSMRIARNSRISNDLNHGENQIVTVDDSESDELDPNASRKSSNPKVFMSPRKQPKPNTASSYIMAGARTGYQVPEDDDVVIIDPEENTQKTSDEKRSLKKKRRTIHMSEEEPETEEVQDSGYSLVQGKDQSKVVESIPIQDGHPKDPVFSESLEQALSKADFLSQDQKSSEAIHISSDDDTAAKPDNFYAPKKRGTPRSQYQLIRRYQNKPPDPIQDESYLEKLRLKEAKERKAMEEKMERNFKRQQTITKDKCMIIMLDSLKSQRKAAANTIKDYLVMEAKEKKNIYLNKSKCRVIYANTPTQPNHYDCGVYVLKFVEKFFENPEQMLETILRRDESAEAWFPHSDIVNKRKEILNLMEQLQKEYIQSGQATRIEHDSDDDVLVLD